MGSIAVLATLLLVPSARADERIQAAPNNRYTTPSVTIDQGERLTFQNLDVAQHDVTASGKGTDGKPLFSTPLIGSNEEAFVDGSQYLTTGSYGFFCSVHADMKGTVQVTSAGTPVPRPAPGAPPASDAIKPTVKVKLRSSRIGRVRRARRLVVEVRVDEAAKVALKVTARLGRRKVSIASGRVNLSAAGKRLPKLKLSRAGRRALAGRSRAALKLTARATDRAGNTSKANASRTLRR